MAHHNQGEHSEGNDILKQVQRLLRSLPDDDEDLIERVAEPYREILDDLTAGREDDATPLQAVTEWFVRDQLDLDPPAADRRRVAQRIEALIEAVIEAGLVDVGGEGLVLDEIMLERPKVLGVQHEGEWLDVRLADDLAAVTVAVHDCVNWQHLMQALEDVTPSVGAVRREPHHTHRPRLVARAEAHYWAIWPGEDGLVELVFAEAEPTDDDQGQRRVRLVLSDSDAARLAAALRASL